MTIADSGSYLTIDGKVNILKTNIGSIIFKDHEEIVILSLHTEPDIRSIKFSEVTSPVFANYADFKAWILEYVDGTNKAIIQSITIPAADWVADEQTITVADVTADNEVDIIIENQTNGDLWADANIYVISQGVDTLTFTCETTPTDDIQIKVRIWL